MSKVSNAALYGALRSLVDLPEEGVVSLDLCMRAGLDPIITLTTYARYADPCDMLIANDDGTIATETKRFELRLIEPDAAVVSDGDGAGQKYRR